MSPDADNRPDASHSPPSDLPGDLVERLSRLDESELRNLISYAKSLLPPTPTVTELLEAREGEQINDVEEQDGYTKVLKSQPCAYGCDECPHGPYLYYVRVEKYPESRAEPSLHWEFIGLIK